MTNQGKDKTFLEVEMIYEEEDLRGVVAIVMQVFFRYRMGERYFTFRSLWGGLLFLLIVRFLFILGKDFSLGYPFHALDVALILYLLLSFWHLMQHSRLEGKGQSVHSYFMGYSHLFFIGRGLFWLLNFVVGLPFRFFKAKPFQFSSKSAFYFTYIIVEPVVTLGLAVVFYFYLKATVTGLLFVVAALILFWIAVDKISSARQIYVDRIDGNIFSEAIKADMVKSNDEQMKAQGMRTKMPLLPSHSSLPPVRKSPSMEPKHKGISVTDALKNLNPSLKNLDKEDKTE